MEAAFTMTPAPRARSRGASVLMPSQTPFTLTAPVARPVDEPAARALRREAHRGRAPDAAGGAGDQHHLALESPGRRIGHQIAATAMISTRYLGAASRASTVARAGVLAGSIHASHAEFISPKIPMLAT